MSDAADKAALDPAAELAIMDPDVTVRVPQRSAALHQGRAVTLCATPV